MTAAPAVDRRRQGALLTDRTRTDDAFISIYTFDPNHIPIEFSLPVGAVDLHRQPKMLDRHPGSVAREGPDPQPEKWPAVVRPTPADEWMVFPDEGTVFAGGQEPLE